MTLLLVALGGALGSVLRYKIDGWVQAGAGGAFPWGILFVNVTGCFVAGLLMTFLLERTSVSDEVRTGLLVGVLGGYTTFSTFSLQSLDLADAGLWGYVAVNVLASVAGALLAVWLGQQLARL
ncbi:MAG: fluoride efflux transporter CrcB [Chloroflexi bacterium]|nr:fluoride efflux transporter CrcB [Chloroflexota bacterium]